VTIHISSTVGQEERNERSSIVLHMTKHWKISGTRDGNPIRLYVSTTDEVISEDLACGPRFSL